jgi:type VI secretion system protein ImpK
LIVKEIAMRPQMAKLVYPVFQYGLQLKARLDAGEPLDMETEQVKLRGYLQSEVEARRNPEYAGDSDADSGGSSISGIERRSKSGFRGPRYAMTCWLDEIFILHSRWQKAWTDRSLERALYNSRDRAPEFWVQARLAESRTGEDALEVFFLCVVLGFRGDYRDDPAKLEAWVSNVRSRLSRRQDQEWPAPDALETPTNVPPLLQRARFQRAALFLGGAIIVAIFVVVFVVLNALKS